MEEVVPEHAGDIFAGRKEEASNVLIGCPVHGSRDEKIFHYRARSAFDKAPKDQTKLGGVGILTIIDLLQSYLRVLRQALLGFAGEHEGLRLLRRGRRGGGGLGSSLRIHTTGGQSFATGSRRAPARSLGMMRLGRPSVVQHRSFATRQSNGWSGQETSHGMGSSWGQRAWQRSQQMEKGR